MNELEVISVMINISFLTRFFIWLQYNKKKNWNNFLPEIIT